jgi:competence protein ComEA
LYEHTELGARQRCGALFLAACIIVLYLGKITGMGDVLSPKPTHRHNNAAWGGTVVELTGDTDRGGIYFIPRGSKVRDFIAMAGLKGVGENPGLLDQILSTGTSIDIRANADSRPEIRFRKMGNASRFALDMPIGLNSATAADLAMVQGIGEKTADEIVRTRAELGRFSSVNDLLRVKGVGPKKIEKFSGSFYLD